MCFFSKTSNSGPDDPRDERDFQGYSDISFSTFLMDTCHDETSPTSKGMPSPIQPSLYHASQHAVSPRVVSTPFLPDMLLLSFWKNVELDLAMLELTLYPDCRHTFR